MSAWQAWLATVGLALPVLAGLWSVRDARQRGRFPGWWAFVTFGCACSWFSLVYVLARQGMLT